MIRRRQMPDGSSNTVVVGAGLAGLATALHLADFCRVVVLVKGSLDEAATPLAQGGIAGVLAADDCIESHVRDTQRAGADLVDERSARFVAERGGAAIEWLIGQGVPFSLDSEGPRGLHLTREGGHAVRRIAHVADATGKAIHDSLLARAAAHPSIELREHSFAIDVITSGRSEERCIGVRVLDTRSGRVEDVVASALVLATGGVGGVYANTTNPPAATGDGIAMAWRAGCKVANMEFIQFHPTSLFHPNARGFLVTEALRGEGALLRLPDGTRFMPDIDSRAELAPRDIVARAIETTMKRHSLDHVLLDATHLGRAFLESHFPRVHSRCLELGIDLVSQPIPVVPAAHYTCGGVVTGLDGSTDLSGLYVVGEAACTGLHGANRLASNSLLECVVMGKACAEAILSSASPVVLNFPADTRVAGPRSGHRRFDAAAPVDAFRRLMSRHVGIVRTTAGLECVIEQIQSLRTDSVGREVTRDSQEYINLLDCASLIVRSALTRRESRGAHFNSDYSDTSIDTQATPTTRIE
jgi:L-aspartate oxidase